jgi:hypothetical protein
MGARERGLGNKCCTFLPATCMHPTTGAAATAVPVLWAAGRCMHSTQYTVQYGEVRTYLLPACLPFLCMHVGWQKIAELRAAGKTHMHACMHVAVQQTLYFADPWVPACMTRLPGQAPYFPCTFVPMPSMPKPPHANASHACMHASAATVLHVLLHPGLHTQVPVGGHQLCPCSSCCCFGPVSEVLCTFPKYPVCHHAFATMHACHA